MLINFSVTNYRSVHGTQSFSMIASKDTDRGDQNCIDTNIAIIPNALRSAVLYGANASGKSNFISALAFMRSMIETSATGIREGQALNVAPFRFDENASQSPSEFEVTFLENDVRYQYGFALTSTRVTREWLLVYVKRKAQRWFEREYSEKENRYEWYFGSHLTSGHQRELWKESTRANALFLSTAVNLNSEQLRPIFNWFVNQLIIIPANQSLAPFDTMNRLHDTHFKTQLIQFLQSADLGIVDVKLNETKKANHLSIHHMGENIQIQNKETDIPLFFHQGKNKLISFDYHEESHGTQRLFSYAGPMLDVLEQGKILVIDELDSSLHTKMVRFLVGLMHDPSVNKKNAQLIFSSHNTSLLDNELFRRDQIWFIEKDNEFASQLYPLTDFSPRKGEALEKGYLAGRYGALPFFGEFKL